MKKLALIITSVLLLSSCYRSVPADWRNADNTGSESVSESASESEEETAPDSAFGVTVNMAELFGFNEVLSIMPIDDRYFAALVYDGENNIRYVIDAANEPWEVAEYGLYDENNAAPITVGNRVLKETDGGIYEDKNGKLTELLPPVDETTFNEYGYSLDARYYRYFGAIDDNRFVYTMGGYEWTWGFGVYDFSTGEYKDAPDTRNFYAVGKKDNIIFSQISDSGPNRGIYATDAETLETRYFLNEDVFPLNDGLAPITWAFTPSPDNEHILFFTESETNRLEYTICIINSTDGELEWSRTLNDIYVTDVKFFGGNVIVLSGNYSGRSQYVYTIPITC